MSTATKIYTNASNTARAAKAELSKKLGLDKKDVLKGEHFDVVEVDGGFQWAEIKPEPVVGEFTHCPHCNIHLDNGYQIAENVPELTREYVCLACDGEFGEKLAPVVKGEGIKIQKDREERNGVKRPSAGGKCAQLWDLFDVMYAEKGMVPTPKPAKQRSAELGLDPVTTQVQLYRWREFMGFKGK
ncbi:hypothetical protein pVco14_050 [Vibrio phage pVco-14]|nr:hypothetical protein pVco14_050 [Vibrio phage pVco-14]